MPISRKVNKLLGGMNTPEVVNPRKRSVSQMIRSALMTKNNKNIYPKIHPKYIGELTKKIFNKLEKRSDTIKHERTLKNMVLGSPEAIATEQRSERAKKSRMEKPATEGEIEGIVQAAEKPATEGEIEGIVQEAEKPATEGEIEGFAQAAEKTPLVGHTRKKALNVFRKRFRNVFPAVQERYRKAISLTKRKEESEEIQNLLVQLLPLSYVEVNCTMTYDTDGHEVDVSLGGTVKDILAQFGIDSERVSRDTSELCELILDNVKQNYSSIDKITDVLALIRKRFNKKLSSDFGPVGSALAIRKQCYERICNNGANNWAIFRVVDYNGTRQFVQEDVFVVCMADIEIDRGICSGLYLLPTIPEGELRYVNYSTGICMYTPGDREIAAITATGLMGFSTSQGNEIMQSTMTAQLTTMFYDLSLLCSVIMTDMSEFQHLDTFNVLTNLTLMVNEENKCVWDILSIKELVDKLGLTLFYDTEIDVLCIKISDRPNGASSLNTSKFYPLLPGELHVSRDLLNNMLGKLLIGMSEIPNMDVEVPVWDFIPEAAYLSADAFAQHIEAYSINSIDSHNTHMIGNLFTTSHDLKYPDKGLGNTLQLVSQFSKLEETKKKYKDTEENWKYLASERVINTFAPTHMGKLNQGGEVFSKFTRKPLTTVVILKQQINRNGTRRIVYGLNLVINPSIDLLPHAQMSRTSMVQIIPYISGFTDRVAVPEGVVLVPSSTESRTPYGNAFYSPINPECRLSYQYTEEDVTLVVRRAEQKPYTVHNDCINFLRNILGSVNKQTLLDLLKVTKKIKQKITNSGKGANNGAGKGANNGAGKSIDNDAGYELLDVLCSIEKSAGTQPSEAFQAVVYGKIAPILKKYNGIMSNGFVWLTDLLRVELKTTVEDNLLELKKKIEEYGQKSFKGKGKSSQKAEETLSTPAKKAAPVKREASSKKKSRTNRGDNEENIFNG